MRLLILALCIVAAACAQQESASDSAATVVTETVAAGTDSFQSSDPLHDHGQPPAADTSATAPTIESARRIGLDDAVMLLDRGEAVLVDVRGPGPYAAQHARGAIEIPESEIVNRIADVPMGKMIITYCT